MQFCSFWTNPGGRIKAEKVPFEGELIATSGDRVTIRTDDGQLHNVHKHCVNIEPTPEQIAAHCEAFRKTWGRERLRRDEFYKPAGTKFYATNGVTTY